MHVRAQYLLANCKYTKRCIRRVYKLSTTLFILVGNKGPPSWPVILCQSYFPSQLSGASQYSATPRRYKTLPDIVWETLNKLVQSSTKNGQCSILKMFYRQIKTIKYHTLASSVVALKTKAKKTHYGVLLREYFFFVSPTRMLRLSFWRLKTR